LLAYQYQREYRLSVIIDNYYRDAIHAEQRRLARAGRAHRVATVAISIRRSVRSLFASADVSMSEPPIADPGLVTSPSGAALIV
jgi:hypothetical protein